MIKAAVGDKTNWNPISNPQPVATKLLALAPGIVKTLPDFEAIEKEYDVKIEHHLHVGDTITPYRTNLDGCGYVIAGGCNSNVAISKAAEVKELIDKSILRIYHN